MKKPGAPKGSRNAAKAVTNSDKIFIRCRESDKAKWLAVAKMKRESLSVMVIRVMNALKEEDISVLPVRNDGSKGSCIHIRCLPEDKAAWEGLADHLSGHLSQLVRYALNKEADKVLAINKG